MLFNILIQCFVVIHTVWTETYLRYSITVRFTVCQSNKYLHMSRLQQLQKREPINFKSRKQNTQLNYGDLSHCFKKERMRFPKWVFKSLGQVTLTDKQCQYNIQQDNLQSVHYFKNHSLFCTPINVSVSLSEESIFIVLIKLFILVCSY